MKIIITIDPGKSGTGYAVWDALAFNGYKPKPVYPIESGIFQNKNTDFQLSLFDRLLIKYNPSKVYIEDAAVMEGSVKGRAAKYSGSVIVLAEYIGRVMQICSNNYVVYELVPVIKWKGTLTKHIVKNRILRKLPRIKAHSHDWDAIGLGLYLMGVINQ